MTKDISLLWIGLDVGSTTVKVAVLDPSTKDLLYWDYQRHHADQAGVVASLLGTVHQKFPGYGFRVAICGSGGEPFAKVTGAFFIQEVVANSIAIKDLYPGVRAAIELGGQDAKVIFFRVDDKTGAHITSDMRMNGSCAGGTGAFVDQIAELLNVKTEDFDALAAQGTTVYNISGRCGVFAKTDIQPLLNQGVSRADLALSCFHAIAKQTIGGLAQGMDIHPPVIFEGGPLTFNPVLVRVFKEKLNLNDTQVVEAEHPEVIVAMGAALSTQVLFGQKPSTYRGHESLVDLSRFQQGSIFMLNSGSAKFFETPQDKESFHTRFPRESWSPQSILKGSTTRAYLGIDGGSTTTKFVVMAEDGTLLDKFYTNNQGDPLRILKEALLSLRQRYRDAGATLEIIACGTTGYAENLFATALKADFHTVETVSHAEASKTIDPNVSFILDVGGQDMKAIFVREGVVTGIVLNEACSAGCGSFLETYAKSLKIPVQEVAELSFSGENPSKLGSRCTVFMNSSIITEQKTGKTTAEIMGGLCRSIVENVFTKVVRISNLDALGNTIIVQGGTFKNDAVLRAFEQYTDKKVIRPEFPGEMGAIGIALLTRKYVAETVTREGSFTSRFIGLDLLEEFTYTTQTGNICRFCTNNCNRTVITFGDGTHFITGNRCEKGTILGDPKDGETKTALMKAIHQMDAVPDMMKVHREVLTKDYPVVSAGSKLGIIIGIPQTLEFWTSLPFWKAIFTSLGAKVRISKKSSYPLFEKGLANVPSDTVCFPAKLAHGHIQDLIEQGVDRIFMPMMVNMPVEHQGTKASFMCPLIQGYPEVIDKSDEPTSRFGIPFDHPIFYWHDYTFKEKQVVQYLVDTYAITAATARRAYQEGERVSGLAAQEQLDAGQAVLDKIVGTKDFAVILSGRPYHSDELINHQLSQHFTKLGVPVLTLDSVPEIHGHNITSSRMSAYNAYHTRMISAAFHAAKNPHLELVQIVSFGCGHDAIISDEMARILREKSNKEMLVLKLDEGENEGPLSIRVKSFIETVRIKRKLQLKPQEHKTLGDPYAVKFTKLSRNKTILIPNLSAAFGKVIAAVVQSEGYQTYSMPLADERAIELGKKYVHNDICFPAQINIGEILRTLESGAVDPKNAIAGLANNCKDCRAGHYMMLARKALDEAGYQDMALITTGEDDKNAHPGFTLGVMFQVRMIMGLAMIDAIESMVRAVRPYERNAGETDRVQAVCLDRACQAVAKGMRECKQAIRFAVAQFNAIPSDRTVRKPRVGILGEVLLNFHPSSNGNVEKYLEHHGMEVIQPALSDFFRRDFFINLKKGKRDLLANKFVTTLVSGVADHLFIRIGESMTQIMEGFKYRRDHFDLKELSLNVKGLIDETYMPGEGWLMAGEIIELSKEGVNSFVILNPFGCIPNHVTGRGFMKPLKKRLPHIQMLSLDFDPDTAFGNVENRLQMLVITARELEARNLTPSEAVPG